MMMVELTSVPSASLPVDALADHLRLSSGFADDGSQTARLERCLRAAISAIEARIGKALFQRRFALTLSSGWHSNDTHGLPIAPVEMIHVIKIVDRAGSETTIDPAIYTLQKDAHRPILATTGSTLPMVAEGSSVEIELTAGFDATWDGIPADLQEAVLVLAADFYNQNSALGGNIPSVVAALLEPHRQLRVSGVRP